MTNSKNGDPASLSDRRQRRRRNTVMAGAIMLGVLSLQLVAVTTPMEPGDLRPVNIVRMAGFALLALVLALRSTTAFSLMGRDPTMDDELVRANRAGAAKLGYLTLMLGGLVLLGVSLATPLRVIDVLPVLLILGAFVPAVRFARLERRGESEA